jgi:hypothetical protein
MNQSQEREPIEPMITCFKHMTRSQTIAIGLHPNVSAGLASVMMEHQIFKFSNYKHFAIDSVLRNTTPQDERQNEGGSNLDSLIADAVEISQTEILIFTRSPIQYVIIDLSKDRRDINACRIIPGGGMGNFGLSLTLMPGYNEEIYPWVLCKENTYLYLLNPFKN